MKTVTAIVIFLGAGMAAQAQTQANTDAPSLITVNKDPRIELLAKKEAEFAASSAPRAMKGYRLLVLKSNDRDYAMKVRAQLLQNYPDQKVYMSFEAPFIKLRFGNFVEKEDAEKFRNQLMKAKFINNNIYVIPEMVEVKPDKLKANEDE